FFFSSRRRHTRFSRDWSSDVCSSDLSSVPTRWLSASRARFRVALEAESHLVGTLDALQGAVEQRFVSGTQVGRQARLVGAETVEIGRASRREGGGSARGVGRAHWSQD